MATFARKHNRRARIAIIIVVVIAAIIAAIIGKMPTTIIITISALRSHTLNIYSYVYKNIIAKIKDFKTITKQSYIHINICKNFKQNTLNITKPLKGWV